MTKLLLLLTITFLAACPSTTPHPILTDRMQAKSAYRYASVDTDRGKAIESQIDRAEIVTRYASNGRVAYVVQDATATQRLGTHPFQPLQHATLVVRVMRVSDINGWGTGANGEVHRHTTQRLEIPRAKLAQAFTLLQKLETAPVGTIEEVWPKSLDEVEEKKPVAMYERGYQLVVEARLVTLYGLDFRTPYTRL